MPSSTALLHILNSGPNSCMLRPAISSSVTDAHFYSPLFKTYPAQMKVLHSVKSLTLVLSAMVLLSAAAPYQCREPKFSVCGEEGKQTNIQDRLLVRHVITTEYPSFVFNVTATVTAVDMQSLAEDFDERPSSRQQALTTEPCTKKLPPIEDTMCQWSYKCDFSPLRLPATIYQARLTGGETKQVKAKDSENWKECVCTKVKVPVTVLRFQNCTLEGKEEWTQTSIPVDVGYSCHPAQ